MWLVQVILLANLAVMASSIYTRGQSGIFDNPVSHEEARKFFNGVYPGDYDDDFNDYEVDENPAARTLDSQSKRYVDAPHASKRARRNGRQSRGGGSRNGRQSRRGGSEGIDRNIKGFQDRICRSNNLRPNDATCYNTLLKLSNGKFNGYNFQFSEQTGNTISGTLKDAQINIGGNLWLNKNAVEAKLEITFPADNNVLATPKNVVIKYTGGKSFFQRDNSNTQESGLTYNIPIDIEKPADSEEFRITKFAIAHNIQRLMGYLGIGANFLSGLYPEFDVVKMIIDAMDKRFLQNIEGFGALGKNDNGLQIAISMTSGNEKSLLNELDVHQITLLINQEAQTDTSRSYGFFVQIKNILEKLGKIIPDFKKLHNETFFLKEVEGDLCAFITTADMHIGMGVKDHSTMNFCFGNQTSNKTTEAFKFTHKGLHIVTQIDVGKAINASCWKGIGHNETFADGVYGGVLAVYAQFFKDSSSSSPSSSALSKLRFKVNLLNDVSLRAGFVLNCFQGLLANAPGWITNGTLVIKHIEKNEAYWKLGVGLKLKEPYNKLPFYQNVAFDSFDFLAEKNGTGGNKTWSVSIKSSMTLNNNSKVDVSLSAAREEDKKKEPNELEANYNQRMKNSFGLEISSAELNLQDVFTAGTFFGSEFKVLKNFGVKNFFMSMKTSGSDLEFKVRGNPIIYGFSALQLSASIKKKDGNAKTGTADAGKGGTFGAAFGVYMDMADFDSIMKDFFKMDKVSMQWLSGLKAIVVVSNAPAMFELKAAETKERRSDIHHTQRREHHQVKFAETLQRHKRTEAQTASIRTPVEFVNLTKAFEMELKNTITFGLAYTIPKEKSACKENKMCEFMVDQIGGKEVNVTNSKRGEISTSYRALVIQGALNGGVFELQARVVFPTDFYREEKVPYEDENGVPQHHDSFLKFEEASLKLKVGATPPEVTISLSLKYANPHIGAVGNNIITFTGEIGLTPTSLTLRFKMEGYIKPYQITKYIAIGNLLVGMGWAGVLPSIEFGVSVKLGRIDNVNDIKPTAIDMAGYIGVSPGEPSNNWIYVSVNSLTLKRVCDAFGIGTAIIPDFLLNTGFPYGLKFSYASKEVEVPNVGTIRSGVMAVGTLNLFGYEVSCDIVLTPTVINLNITMSPLDWGHGALQLYRNTEDKENGPIVIADLTTESKDFKFYMEGGLNFISILEVYVKVDITPSHFIMHFNGPIILGFLTADIRVEASVEGLISLNGGPLFYFHATATSDIKNSIIKYLTAFLVEMSEIARNAVEEIKIARGKADEAFNDAENKVNVWKSKVGNWKEQLEETKKKLEKKPDPPVCKCDKVCMPFLSWDSRCWKVWGIWVGCPWWNPCFAKVEDLFCLAGCGIQEIITTVKKWTKQAILEIGSVILTGVEGLFTLGATIVDMAKTITASALKLFEKIGTFIADGLLKGSEWLTRQVRKIQIHNVEAEARLTADFTACVRYAYDVTFIGSRYNGGGSACLNIPSFVWSLISSITEGNVGTKGAYYTRETVTELRGELEEVKTSQALLKDEESSSQSRIDSETANTYAVSQDKRSYIPEPHEYNVETMKRWAEELKNVPRPHHVPTKKEMEIIRWTRKKIPRYDVTQDERMTPLIDGLSWMVGHNDNPVGNNATMKRDVISGQNRSLDFDANMSPCVRMKRALSGYSELTDGILKYSKAVQTTEGEMKKSNDVNNEKYEKFRRFIDYADVEHNMTTSATEDAYYILSKLLDHKEELAKRSEIAVSRENTYAIPMIRRQLDNFLNKEKGTTFIKYTELMHSNAVEGYKRSNIPHPADVEGEKVLGNIKEDLQNILSNEDSTLAPMTPRLQALKKNIITMNQYTKTCREN